MGLKSIFFCIIEYICSCSKSPKGIDYYIYQYHFIQILIHIFHLQGPPSYKPIGQCQDGHTKLEKYRKRLKLVKTKVKSNEEEISKEESR